MKKKITILAILILCLFILTGCQCEHEWVDADCTTAKTCAKCGETEGEALGHSWVDVSCAAPRHCERCGETEGEALAHTWQDATCAAPKTCTVCGATEGEALPHTWVDANYQAPKTCSVCGGTEGEPLTAYFEEQGLNVGAKTNQKIYDTVCYGNKSKMAKANITFSNYRIFESDAKHAAKEGYEWRAVDVSITFNDQNAWDYGFTWDCCSADYYTNVPLSTGANSTYTVNYCGTDYSDCIGSVENVVQGSWVTSTYRDGRQTHKITSHFEAYFRVPIGYDGTVLAFIDGTDDVKDGMSLHEVANKNTKYFRFD